MAQDSYEDAVKYWQVRMQRNLDAGGRGLGSTFLWAGQCNAELAHRTDRNGRGAAEKPGSLARGMVTYLAPKTVIRACSDSCARAAGSPFNWYHRFLDGRKCNGVQQAEV